MITESRKKELLSTLQKDPANSLCFDCDLENPSNISISFGCFICNTCAKSHNLLSNSKTKTINEDWSLEEIGIVSSGGNSALKEFFNYYNLMETPSNFKYQTKAAEFYKEMLLIVSKDQEFSKDFPSINEGIQLIHTENPNDFSPLNIEESKISYPLLKEQNKKSAFCECLKTACMRITGYGDNKKVKINEENDDISQKNVVKNDEKKPKNVFNRIENKLYVLIEKVKNNEKVQNAGEHMSLAAGRVVRGVKEQYKKLRRKNDEENVQSNEEERGDEGHKHEHQATENSFIRNASTHEISNESLLHQASKPNP
ncbi:hypothetical protein SteCoe_1304 [Stentor coeruleus]|uniref:Arf-GAP domain-containing protein n=1 Tax=Stentor coeruleus TaxID=5963 RepID=A0A1R2D2B0_9CILI|nr:hypothetical protein SteCoe_1304 [Stentor coeruleus]